jgi:hypothetical protein
VGGVVSISGVLPPEGVALFSSDDAPTLWFIGTAATDALAQRLLRAGTPR